MRDTQWMSDWIYLVFISLCPHYHFAVLIAFKYETTQLLSWRLFCVCMCFHARYDLTLPHTYGLMPEPSWFYLCRCSCSLFSICWHLELQHICSTLIVVVENKLWKIKTVSSESPSAKYSICGIDLSEQPLFSSKDFPTNVLRCWWHANKSVLVVTHKEERGFLESLEPLQSLG